jgi:hypothetical protein
MVDDPQAVRDYILYLREDSKTLNDIQERHIRKQKLFRDIEQRNKKEGQKKKIEDQSSSDRAVFEPLALVTTASFLFIITFSNIVHGIPPCSLQFALIRKNRLTAMWHWIIPCSFIFFWYIAGYVRGHSCTKLSPLDVEKGSSSFGIKRRVAQFSVKSPLDYLIGPGRKDGLYITCMQHFADYVGNLKAGSYFSSWHNVGSAYSFLIASLVLCCFPFFNYEEEGMSSKSCVGPWAKAGLVLTGLVMGWFSWVGGSVTGWLFEMGNVAERLRKECLRKGMKLKEGESTGKDRLEAR